MIPGRGLPLEVTRSYNSHDVYEGPFGHGWKFNLEIKLSVAGSGSQETVSIRTWDGVRREFTGTRTGPTKAPSGWLDQLVKNSDGSYTWTQGPCAGGCGIPRYQFNSSGYLASITDPNGNQMSFAYDGSGKLTQVTDASGESSAISYGSNNKIATITDPAGRTFTYGYDANDNLITYTDPAGNTITYGYDGAHKLISITDARGNAITAVKYDDQERVTEYTENGAKWTYSYDPRVIATYKYLPNNSNYWVFNYDANGLVLSEMDPLKNTTYYSYNEKLQLTGVIDPKGAKTSFEYDERGNRTGITDPLGKKTIPVFHPLFNKVTSVTDAMGWTTTFTYDDVGNLIQSADALGNKTSWSYDQYGQVTQQTDALGNVTKYTYDAYGNLISVTDALGNTATVTYDILGNVTGVTDPRGNTSTYVYDALGKPTSMTDALGNVTANEYDKNGNLRKMVDALGHATIYEYDAYNRLTKVRDPLGNEVVRVYDVIGNMTGETDGNGKTKSYSYDLLRRMTLMKYADGTTTTYTHDANGNVTARQDANGNTMIRTSYDLLNRVTELTNPDGSKYVFTYDNVGNILSTTDESGNTILYSYDPIKRRVSKLFPDGTKAKYSYDSLGRMMFSQNINSTINYSYDNIGRLTQVNQNGKDVTYAYDSAGNRIHLGYPDNTSLSYSYDAINRLEGITDSLGNIVARFSYDKRSLPTKMAFINGTETVYTYDSARRLIKLLNSKVAEGSTLSSFEYTYDSSVNVTSLSKLNGTYVYTYDPVYQLKSTTHPSGVTSKYNYDAVGNRQSTTNGEDTTYTANNMNQYTTVNGNNWSYDLNGNLLSDGNANYSYDYENHITEIKAQSGNIKRRYDPLGRIVSRLTSDQSVSYIYDGWRSIMELDQNGTVLGKWIHGPNIDQVIMMQRDKNYFYHYDRLGSVTNITDDQGELVENYEYDAFGSTTITDKNGAIHQASSIGNYYAYTGRVYEANANLYNYRFREYNPRIGRLYQRDPLGYSAGGSNLYTYVDNNPINYTDPLGLTILELIKGLRVCALGGPWAIGTCIVIGGILVYTVYQARAMCKAVPFQKVQGIARNYDGKQFVVWNETTKKYELKPEMDPEMVGYYDLKKVQNDLDEFNRIVREQGLVGKQFDEIKGMKLDLDTGSGAQKK